MAMQGQTIFSAAGDNGAYDNGATLSVDDPAAQPYVTGVGGTKLSTHGVGGTWSGETTWNSGTNDAGGGGISSVWPKPATVPTPPARQARLGVLAAAPPAMRNVPDVSLDSDPNVGYAIYYAAGGGWVVYGGTSTATPLWAGFTALVNQQRLATGHGLPRLRQPAHLRHRPGEQLCARLPRHPRQQHQPLLPCRDRLR